MNLFKTEPDKNIDGYKTTYSNSSTCDVVKNTITNFKIKMMSDLLNT